MPSRGTDRWNTLMTRILADDLTNQALDWAVAEALKCADPEGSAYQGGLLYQAYSVNPLHGMPLLEKYGIGVRRLRRPAPDIPAIWEASFVPEYVSPERPRVEAVTTSIGAHPLEAGCRCFVKAFLGREIEVPEGV